jgi:glycosyltransferase involved in cell wall biosynthesis
MNRPSVSVVVETITLTEGGDAPPSVLDGVLAAVERQTYPRELVELIVVLHDGTAALRGRHPSAKYVSAQDNYFAAKNAGAAAAGGQIIALLDGDCEPAPDWLETLVARFEPGVAVVAGCTRYAGDSITARTFSIPDFAYILGEEGDAASGFNINNLAFRREVLLAHPFDARIRRNGGCYFLFHQLRAAGERVVYEPRAAVAHGLDIEGLGFVRKHFDRGYDGVTVYRLDDAAVLRGTRFFRRLGPLALPAIFARRIAVDWLRMLRHRRQIGIKPLALPYYAAIALTTRLIELAGGLKAAVTPRSAR